MITAVNTSLLAFDNVSTIAPWLSDALCRLAVGGGHATGSLFTNDQVTYLYTQRPVGNVEDVAPAGNLGEGQCLAGAKTETGVSVGISGAKL